MYIIRRAPNNPLLSPIADRQWEARASFNGCPVKRGNVTHLLYRALGRPDPLMSPGGLSTIGKAISINGERFHDRKQFIVPEEPWEKYGCEDPRVTYFEGQYIIFYTALGGMPFGPNNIKVAAAFSTDLEHVTEKHLITPFNAKAMTIFPERINGKITVMFSAHTDEPPAHMVIAQCKKLEDLWDITFWEKWHADFDSHILNPLRSDHDHVEVGAPPIKTKDGWLVVYSYIENYFSDSKVFGIEALLLDLNDPMKIIGRTRGPIMTPEENYEHFGIVPEIVFPSGALLEKNRLDIYYGAADTVCAKASLNVQDLLNAMIPERHSGLVVRAKENPILKPLQEHAWEKRAVFNAGVVDLDGTIHILYRAMGDDNTSVIGYAGTKNGVKITERSPEPAYVPREDFEIKKGDANGNSGCEDPRLTVIGDTVYMAYTAYDGVHAPRAALTSISKTDFLAKKWSKWSKAQLVTPDDYDDKDACLVEEKIGGQYMFLHRISPQLCADLINTLDFKKNRVNRCIEIMGPRPGSWDSKKIGIAGPPIKTEKGWLLIYHGVSKHKTYRLGAALLDLDNPSIVLSRAVDPILEPVDDFEKNGIIPNAIFSCGIVNRAGTLYIYYGGADTVMCVAKMSLAKLLKILTPDNL